MYSEVTLLLSDDTTNVTEVHESDFESGTENRTGQKRDTVNNYVPENKEIINVTIEKVLPLTNNQQERNLKKP